MRLKFIFPPFIFIVFLLILSFNLPRVYIKVVFIIAPNLQQHKINTYQTVSERLEADKKRLSAPVLKRFPWEKLKKYIFHREYDQKRDILGWEVTRRALTSYAHFKYLLNSYFYQAVLKNFRLMPFHEQGDNPCLIERSNASYILPPPSFATDLKRAQLAYISKFYKKFTEKYPDLNVFIYDIKTSEFSNIYEELDSGVKYQRGLIELWNGFWKSLPETICYSELDYDLNTFREYFYKTDHHWTIKAAWKAYAQIIEMIKTKVPDIGAFVVPQKLFRVGNIIFRGSHAKAAAYQVQADELWDFEIALPAYEAWFNDRIKCPRNDRELLSIGQGREKDIFENYYAIYWGHDYGFIRYKAVSGKRNLLMFVDSFSNCMEAYFTAHYLNVYVIDLRYYEKDMGDKFNLAKFLKNHQIDDVLFLYGRAALFESEQFPSLEMLEE